MSAKPKKPAARGSQARSKSAGKSGRRGKKPPPKRRDPPPSLGRRLLKWGLILGLIGALAAGGVLVGGYWYFARGLPDFQKIEDWRPPQVTRIRAADGTVIAELFRERRTVVARADIPEVLVQAVLSAEDADFYDHEGLDYTGMLRALLNSLRAGRITGSGSTITQQTVKNLLLTPEKRFERKAKELILAKRLEDRFDKDQILTIYMNAIYLGHGRYGVAEAARFYFGHTDLSAITPAQAAAIAGLIQSPERLSPLKHSERNAERRAFVLRMMVKNGFLDEAAAERARAADLGLVEAEDPFVDEAQWYADQVRGRLFEAFGEEAVVTGGLDVQTAIDLERQRAALAALREGLRAVDARQSYAKPRNVVPDAEAAAWRAAQLKIVGEGPPRPGVPVRARVKAIEPDDLVVEFGVGEARVPRDALARFADPDNPQASPYGVGDVIVVAVRADGPSHPERMLAVPAAAPQGAVVVIEPGSRHVLALVGGYDHRYYPFDRATQARRQPGSAFKPFVWGAALASKRYTPASTLIDAPETLRMHAGQFWQPKNYTRRYEGPISLRLALAKSINSVAVALAEDVGVPAVQDFARAAGIASPMADGLAMALGASEVYPLELADAYATLAADGRRLPPRFILSVTGPDGPLEWAPPRASDDDAPAIDPAVAYVLRGVMRSVVTDGSGRRLKSFERPVVGKTGTSNEARDAWFVGLLPEVVVAAWVGFDTPKPLGRKEAGGRTALPVVAAYLKAAEAEGPDWPPPPEGVEVRRVVEDGRLAPPGSEAGREEVFLTGTAPTEVAPAAGEIDADSFFREEVGAAPSGPSLAVPAVDVAPLPPTLKPIAPAVGRPAPDPDGDGGSDEGGDDGPKLRPIAPAGADPAGAVPGGDPEDLPP